MTNDKIKQLTQGLQTAFIDQAITSNLAYKPQFITTLQMYLRNNQSIKKTAGAMFVHYRTISYRIEKIKQISGINFDNANEVLAVSNGLIIYKMLKEIE